MMKNICRVDINVAFLYDYYGKSYCGKMPTRSVVESLGLIVRDRALSKKSVFVGVCVCMFTRPYFRERYRNCPIFPSLIAQVQRAKRSILSLPSECFHKSLQRRQSNVESRTSLSHSRVTFHFPSFFLQPFFVE